MLYFNLVLQSTAIFSSKSSDATDFACSTPMHRTLTYHIHQMCGFLRHPLNDSWTAAELQTDVTVQHQQCCLEGLPQLRSVSVKVCVKVSVGYKEVESLQYLNKLFIS